MSHTIINGVMVEKIWRIKTPQDNAWYCGKSNDTHEWSIDKLRAKIFPTYGLANAYVHNVIDRDYAGIGFYTSQITDE